MDYSNKFKKVCSYLRKQKILITSSLHLFYIVNPALIYAIIFMFALWASLEKHYFIFLFLFFLPRKLKIISFSIVFCAFILNYLYYPAFPKNIEPEKIHGTVKITSVTTQGLFKKGYSYKGRFKYLEIDNDKKYKNIPCNISYKGKKLSTNHLYSIKGTASLANSSKYNIFVKVQDIEPIKKILTFSEARDTLKKRANKKVRQLVKKRNAANFLSTLITGIPPDTFLNFSFKRVGLQHILAISGFHFSIIMLIFLLLFRKIFSYRILPYTLLVVINLYFLYIGFTPSIFRAYISLQLIFIAQIFNKKNRAINSLGICMLLELIIDPLILFNIGFQLSFLSVGAIFIIYPKVNSYIALLLKKRNKIDLSELNIISKMGGITCNFIRESISLSIAINLVLIPVLLYKFNKFPLICFVYNIFFPPLIFVSIFFLALAYIFSAIHLTNISNLFSYITSSFTEFILKFILYPPATIEYNLYLRSPPFSLVISFLIICFISFIVIKKKGDNGSLATAVNLI